ncbi:MAG: hypothetical protein IPQ04_04520 [Saprospiraceae bacterium]|nr:hypothetical protein [Saprospiraceae bacterium]
MCSTNLGNGNYIITVTDANGCVTTAQATIASISIVSIVDIIPQDVDNWRQ